MAAHYFGTFAPLCNGANQKVESSILIYFHSLFHTNDKFYAASCHRRLVSVQLRISKLSPHKMTNE